MTRSSFSELLQQRKESYEAEATKNKEIIDEWTDAIGRLFAQLKSWLTVSDPQGILQVDEVQTEVYEPNIGRYHAPRLNIRAFGKWVAVLPKARKTVGTARPPRAGAPVRATGRVDITDEIRRYVLYRFDLNGQDSWCIEGFPSTTLQTLTPELFEEALMSYFAE